ncbi:hydrogenase-1 expression HyaE [Terasakiella pusilla]|jgi:hydrogenase-1 operon protein HyaE|uniref:hydrogenase-1 expression HyaE n=1 Tax=Terasakiella pusilla TaxID=64973 RepID=UPI003AA7B13D
MFSPLLESVIEREKMPVVDEAALEAFCAENDMVALLVAGDYKRVSTVNDLAVILPELVKEFKGAFAPCVASRDQEALFQGKYGFVLLPTLVFLKGNEVLGTLSGVHDWTDFISQIKEIITPAKKTDAAE